MLSIDFYRPNYDMDVKELVDKLIDLSFAEDIGDGDHTTLCCIPEDAMGKSHLLIKEDGILAGVEVAKEVFHRFDPTMQVEVLMQDGTRVKKGDIAMIVTGKTRSLLQTERLMLNIMQRMSGIATMTHPQDDSRHAYAGETGCQDWWWLQPPHRTVRHDSAEGQPCRLCWWHRQCHRPLSRLSQGEGSRPED